MVCKRCATVIPASAEYCPVCKAPTKKATTANKVQSPIDPVSNQPKSTAIAPPLNRDVESGATRRLKKRYKDAYAVANVTVTIGKLVKGFGIGVILVGIVIAIFSGGQGGSTLDSRAFLAVGILIAFLGALLFCGGVLVSAQGQTLLASLDGAVNSSPFLTDDQRADIMSI